jgi:hypothetical protein
VVMGSIEKFLIKMVLKETLNGLLLNKVFYNYVQSSIILYSTTPASDGMANLVGTPWAWMAPKASVVL